MLRLIENKFRFVTLILLCFTIGTAYGIDPIINAKYPFVLVNDDHGILAEEELADESYGKTLRSFSDTTSSIYWKCYRSDSVNISYRVMEYSKEHGEYVAYFNIDAIDENGIVNQYGMRRGLGISYCKETSDIWKKLMENQEYVCINGYHISSKNKLYEDQIIDWEFNKLKTKKGSNNYFSSNDHAGKEIYP